MNFQAGARFTALSQIPMARACFWQGRTAAATAAGAASAAAVAAAAAAAAAATKQ